MLLDGETLKRKLKEGEICLGTWTDSSDPCIAELLCGSGFDFLIIDAEHGALSIETVQQNIMATKGTGVAPMVRVPWNDPVLIKPVLDAGAAGVLVPLIKTAEEARRAVAACMYPPAGIRGFGPRRPSDYERDLERYIPAANEGIVVWVQIEHIDAVDNIAEIVRVPGLAGVFVGSNDLSASMGLLGQPRHSQVLEAITRVIIAASEAGVPAGIAGPADPQAAHQWLNQGMQFITLGGVAGFLAVGAEEAVSGVKRLLG